MLQRAMHAGEPECRAIHARDLGDDEGSAEIARVAMRDRRSSGLCMPWFRSTTGCEVEIDAERRKVAPLPRRIVADREQALRTVAMQRHDLGDRRHAGERRRQARDRAALLIGRDPERRTPCRLAGVLQRVDLLADRLAVLPATLRALRKTPAMARRSISA